MQFGTYLAVVGHDGCVYGVGKGRDEAIADVDRAAFGGGFGPNDERTAEALAAAGLSIACCSDAAGEYLLDYGWTRAVVVEQGAAVLRVEADAIYSRVG